MGIDELAGFPRTAAGVWAYMPTHRCARIASKFFAPYENTFAAMRSLKIKGITPISSEYAGQSFQLLGENGEREIEAAALFGEGFAKFSGRSAPIFFQKIVHHDDERVHVFISVAAVTDKLPAAGGGVESQVKAKSLGVPVGHGELRAIAGALGCSKNEHTIHRTNQANAVRYGVQRVGVIHLGGEMNSKVKGLLVCDFPQAGHVAVVTSVEIGILFTVAGMLQQAVQDATGNGGLVQPGDV